MVKCGVCGAENEREALFCGVCGSRLNAEVTETTPTEAGTTAAGGDEDVVVPRPDGRGRAPGEPDGEQVPVPPEGTGTETVVVGGASVTCQVCGTVNDATRTYCRKCANELRAAPPPPPPPPPPDGGPRISPLLIGIGAAAIVGVVVIAVVLMNVLGNGPVAEASPTPAAPSAGPTAPATGEPPATETPTATPPVITEGDVPTGRIVFVRCPAAGGTCELIIRNADGTGGGTRITGSSEGAGDPGFSTDGTRVAYTTRAGLRILTLGPGFPFVQITDNRTDSNAFWSPTDESIAFSRVQGQSREIRLLDVATGTSDRLTNNDVEDHDPVFTPDGLAIIWVEGVDDGRELVRMDLVSGDVTRLTDDGFNDVDPVVASDGRRLAFVSNRESGGALELFLMDLETLEITRLFGVDDGDVHDPAWSPGGRYLAVTAGPQRNRDILIYDTVSGNVIELTGNADNDLSPAWR